MVGVTGVVLIGGNTRGKRFRPLTLTVPKPLLPVAGKPMVTHHIEALAKVPGIIQIVLLGFYKEIELEGYVKEVAQAYDVTVRYVCDVSHDTDQHGGMSAGTAGGLLAAKNVVLEHSPDYLMILNCDVVSDFPTVELLNAHVSRFGGPPTTNGVQGTLMVLQSGATLDRQCIAKHEYGSIGTDEAGLVTFYTEKPKDCKDSASYINGGMYCFSVNVMDYIVSLRKKKRSLSLLRSSNTPSYLREETELEAGKVSFETDVFRLIVDGQSTDEKNFPHRLYTMLSTGPWSQCKTATCALRCAGIYYGLYKSQPQSLLIAPSEDLGYTVIAPCVINPTARIGAGSKIGPNVSIGPNCSVGDGCRIKNSMIYDNAEIKARAYVSDSIIAWDCVVKEYARVEGANVKGNEAKEKGLKWDTTVLGASVLVKAEAHIYNSLVLPHKEIAKNMFNEIYL